MQSGMSFDPGMSPEQLATIGGVTTYSSRGRRRRRLLIIAMVSVGALLGIGIGGYAALAGKIHTFDGSGLAGVRPSDAGGQNILLIGTDSRAGASGSLGGSGDPVGRSDTTILVHVYPGATSAVAVSIPRDTLVTIPPCRLPDGSWTHTQTNTMFNTAFSVGQTSTGNPACTVNTVEKLTGLRVDHTVVANFAGFAAMSQAVGGVPVCLPNAVYEGDLKPEMRTKGALLFRAGQQTVEGARALDYVRIRHGIGDGSDIGRIKRQQAFLSSLVMTIRHKGLSADHILPLADAASSSLTFDPGLSSPTKLLSFAMGLVNLNPSAIDFVTMPWRYDGARVAIVQPDAEELWSALRSSTPLTGPVKAHRASSTPTTHASTPPVVSGPVTVLNGTWTSGLASEAARKLSAAGFQATAGNAPVRSYVASEIHFPAADRARAEALAHVVNATLVPDPKATTVVLYVGTSHDWLRAGSTNAGSSPSAPASGVPTSITSGIRKANANVCSDLSLGAKS